MGDRHLASRETHPLRSLSCGEPRVQSGQSTLALDEFHPKPPCPSRDHMRWTPSATRPKAVDGDEPEPPSDEPAFHGKLSMPLLCTQEVQFRRQAGGASRETNPDLGADREGDTGVVAQVISAGVDACAFGASTSSVCATRAAVCHSGSMFHGERTSPPDPSSERDRWRRSPASLTREHAVQRQNPRVSRRTLQTRGRPGGTGAPVMGRVKPERGDESCFS